MIQTPEEFLHLVTVNKDRNLGKYEREMSEALFQDLLSRCADMPLKKEDAASLFDTIQSFLEKHEPSVIDKTNLEVHFVIQKEAVTQYITPYNKEYRVGRTLQIIKESVIWVFRPEGVEIGEHLDITTNTGRNRTIEEKNGYTEGKAKDMLNVIALHTYEHYEPESLETSTIHITVFIPVGLMMNDIVALYKAQQQTRMNAMATEKKMSRRERRALRHQKKHKKKLPSFIPAKPKK